MIRIVLYLAVLLLTGLTGPELLPAAQEQQINRTGEDRDKEQYERSMHDRLGKLGAQLDELKKKTGTSSAQVEKKMRIKIAEAEKKRHAAERKLKELGMASRDTWRKFSADFEKAAKEFESSFERELKHVD